MCTVSWAFSSQGYDLFFNRDEQKSREKAKPPSMGEKSGVKYISPEDGRSHGTWLLVNEYGISICLLNHSIPVEERKDRSFLSRGLLPLRGIDCPVVSEVVEIIRSMDLTEFDSFHLVVIGPPRELCLLTWDGTTLKEEHLDTVEVPLTTSSYRSDEIISFRKGLFAEITADVNDEMSKALQDFHHYNDPDTGPFSVMMNRSDACTLSISHIKVDTDKIKFLYEELAWDEGGESSSTQVVLPRSGDKCPG